MKKVFLAIVQFVSYVVVFFAGSLWDPFHLKWFLSRPTPQTLRYFVPDGLILMLLLFVVIVALEAATKKLRIYGLVSAIALLAALSFGLWSKFGWLTT